jgi:hypothetical protein
VVLIPGARFDSELCLPSLDCVYSWSSEAIERVGILTGTDV